MLDARQLPTTSSKKNLPWRETRLGFLLVQTDGPLVHVHRLADKRELLELCGPEDRLLAIRMQQYPPRPEVLLVDDFDAARQALS
jgi:hypothetical protein